MSSFFFFWFLFVLLITSEYRPIINALGSVQIRHRMMINSSHANDSVVIVILLRLPPNLITRRENSPGGNAHEKVQGVRVVNLYRRAREREKENQKGRRKT
jgi:hypothetical protein